MCCYQYCWLSVVFRYPPNYVNRITVSILLQYEYARIFRFVRSLPRWVWGCLLFAAEHRGNTFEHTPALFVNTLGKRIDIEPWRGRPASDAVQIEPW